MNVRYYWPIKILEFFHFEFNSSKKLIFYLLIVRLIKTYIYNLPILPQITMNMIQYTPLRINLNSVLHKVGTIVYAPLK